MASYDIRPLQLRILKVLLAIDEVCRKHQLSYYCWAGTMLGAVRHKGFIPWDDDMDIAMPRPDYDKFMAHAAEWLPKPYEAVCAETDPRYPFPFGKVQDGGTTLIERKHIDYIGGIYVDVFPIDGVPANSWKRRWTFMQYEFYKRMLYFQHRDPYKRGFGLSSLLPLFCQKFFTNAQLQRWIRAVEVRCPYDSTSLVADYDDGLRGVMEKSLLGKPSPVVFEGETVMGVERAADYLTRKYGDYMVIPKHSEQRQHNFHFLSYDMSYHDYDDTRDNMRR